MENTLYYTFSTIAQALAGAVALLGAFVLYKVQSIDRELHDAADSVFMSWQDDNNLQVECAQRALERTRGQRLR